MTDAQFEIVEHLCVLRESKHAWNLEFNIVRWNDNSPKYDIREWDAKHKQYGAGVTMDIDTLQTLVKYYDKGVEMGKIR
jgi:bacterial seryl-tRNA synthetase related